MKEDLYSCIFVARLPVGTSPSDLCTGQVFVYVAVREPEKCAIDSMSISCSFHVDRSVPGVEPV